MANPKLSTLFDAFTAASVDTGLWSSITGTATLDTLNDLVTLPQPTTSGSTNAFGSSRLFDATSSQISAQIGVVPNGLGNTKTIFKLTVDASNSVALRVEAKVFKFTLQTAGTTVTTTLPTYDPDAHRWWRLRESAGTWYAEASADRLNWVLLASSAYSWSTAAMTFALQTSAGAAEASGLVAWIAHVNTELGGRADYNPNFPRMEQAWGPFWNCNGGDSPLDRYVDVTRRSRAAFTTSRGRQYELDQIRAGEAGITLANDDGALDPTNSAGPWYGHIEPYQPYRARAQWPSTINLLSQTQATAGDLGGEPLGLINVGADGPSIFSSTDPGGGSFVTSATAWHGSVVGQSAVSAGSALTYVVQTPQPAVEPGRSYTTTIRVRNVTASTSLQVRAVITWIDATGAQVGGASVGTITTLTGAAAAGWTTLTASGVARAQSAQMWVGVLVAATPAAACAMQYDGWQLEHGMQSSPWTCPGRWEAMYSGYVERWPSSWTAGGSYGLVAPTTVDALSLLSQVQLRDPLTQEISYIAPRFMYKMDDPEGSTSASDATGQNPGAQLAVSKQGPGSFVFGSEIASTDADGGYVGSAGTVATISNSNPGEAVNAPATFLSLGKAGIVGPADPTLWTRMIAFRYTGPTIAAQSVLWICLGRQVVNNTFADCYIILKLAADGRPVLSVQGPSGTFVSVFPGGATNCADGDWHLLLFGYSQSTQQVFFSQDGTTAAYYGSINNAVAPVGLVSDNIGGSVAPVTGNLSGYNFKGDVSFVAEFPRFFLPGDIKNIYGAWKSACAGESTDARYRRILKYSGYKGPSSVEAGLTTSMGPANIDGQDAVTALQGVVDTEGGEHFVDKSGSMTFRSRSSRYNALEPIYIFGEDVANGEWPYEDCLLDFDPTHISNIVTVTQESTSQTFVAQDPLSIENYFPRTLERTINSSSALECQDASNYLKSRYKKALTRVDSLVLHPSGYPALWPICLALEIGMRVRVVRRPNGAPPITLDCFLENIAVSMDEEGEATWTLQLSPVDSTPYAAFAAWHTTLRTSVASGVTSISVNASQDTVNPLRTQLAAGQQLTLGQGTANAETVTVLAVGATSPGWTNATLTLTAATTKAHTTTDVICESLPAGTTDPTTWDGNVFDAVAFAY
ncbi:hypothetical protein HY68_01695 [Streptomyces sp. AcH 505]|uniref:hypothetical protein n=1 Tax=Streptomyces sp. AcH 505 TaxID=352211 RepID=UPI0005921783|nr:hypothetical protein HY68_01695 [Streptomyces sp. AcH 505]